MNKPPAGERDIDRKRGPFRINKVFGWLCLKIGYPQNAMGQRVL